VLTRRRFAVKILGIIQHSSRLLVTIRHVKNRSRGLDKPLRQTAEPYVFCTVIVTVGVTLKEPATGAGRTPAGAEDVRCAGVWRDGSAARRTVGRMIGTRAAAGTLPTLPFD